MKAGSILVFGIVLVAIVIALTVAIIAAAPYIAIGTVLLGLGWLAVTFDDHGDDQDPPSSGSSGPPAVQ